MVDNVGIKDGTSQTITVAAKDIGGVAYPRHIITDANGNDVSFPGLQAYYNSAFFSGSPPTAYTNGQMVPLQANQFGALRITLGAGNGQEAKAFRVDQALVATSVSNLDQFQTIGSISFLWDATAGKLRPNALPSKVTPLLSSAASDNETNITTSATTLKRVTGYNTNAAGRWLKIYDKASTIVPASDVPALTFYLPPTATFTFDLDNYCFQNGARFRITTGYAATDTGAISSGDIVGMNITRTY